jgi:hypothetical protein
MGLGMDSDRKKTGNKEYGLEGLKLAFTGQQTAVLP